MEQKEGKSQLKALESKFTLITWLFFAGAIVVVLVGLLWGILAAVGSDYAPGSYRFAQFLQGFLFAIFGGGVLAGMGLLVSKK
jgi:hypothetical protein